MRVCIIWNLFSGWEVKTPAPCPLSMEPDLSRYEIAPEAIINSENASIFNSVSRQEHMNASTQSLRAPAVSNPAGATPRIPTGSLATDNQIMANYISSPHPDLPNQYNIIIADDDDDDEDDVISQTLNSPQAHSMDLHLPGSTNEQSMSEQSMSEQSMSEQSMGAVPYRSYTVQFKLNALDWYYKNGENKNLTAKMFSVDRKRIRDWLLDERNLRSDPTPQRTKRKRANSLPQYKDIEDALYKFYLTQREKGVRPKNAELRAKSLEFSSMLGYRETFKASIHWLCNWKRRNKISFAVPEHMIQNATEEEDDTGAATPPFMEERLGRTPQTYKVGHVGGGNYANAGVDGSQSAAGGNASVGYVVNSVSSRSSTGSGRACGSSGADSLAIPRSSNGASIGGRAYGGIGIDTSSLAPPRSTSNVGGVAYGGTRQDGLMGSRNLGVDGGLGMSVGERRREATHQLLVSVHVASHPGSQD